jgi:hypothetical protein
MPRYRIHRIKETPRENFRWAPHTGGEATVKLKDYEASRTVESATPYAAWKLLIDENEALRPGDLLEILKDEQSDAVPSEPPELLIAKYIGFDPAKWFVPEPKRADARTDLPTLSSEAAVSHAAPAEI